MVTSICYVWVVFCSRLLIEREKWNDLYHHACSRLSQAGNAGILRYLLGSRKAADPEALGFSRSRQDSPSAAEGTARCMAQPSRAGLHAPGTY